MAKKQAAGIDLGTTFSVAAWVDQTGRTALIDNSEGDVLTPSAVLLRDEAVVVGKEAKKAGLLRPGRLALWVKRDMGSPVYSQPIEGVYLPPEVIQACVLNKLRAEIVPAVGPDAAVVITVPAFFDEPRRRATAVAGEIAGLDVLDIVNEPTAAALAFGEHLGMLGPSGSFQEKINILIYDLGGGTFDVTLLEVHPAGFRTIATDGDVQLGGRDWDMRLIDLVSKDFVKQFREDPRENPVSLQRLLTEVEHGKHTLTSRQNATVRVDHAGNSQEVKVTRQEFEEATADLVERTRGTAQETLAAGGLGWKDVSRILLVGGSTRMPMVSKMLEDLSGIAPDYVVSPDEAVARGAAIYAKYLLDSAAGGPLQPKFRVTNVNSHSLGIEGIEQETLEKVNSILIRRNTALPARATKEFVTKIENQQSIAIRVLEGESAIPSECTLIGRTVIKDLPENLPKGHPVEVTYEYGANGRLSVRASVPKTDREVGLEIDREGSLPDARIPRWKEAVCGGGGFAAFKALAEQELQLAGKSQEDTTQSRSLPGGATTAEAQEPTAALDEEMAEAQASKTDPRQAEHAGEAAPPGAGSLPPRRAVARKRAKRRPVNIAVEMVKIVLGAFAGLIAGLLVLWWVFKVDPLRIAPKLKDTFFEFVVPDDLLEASNTTDRLSGAGEWSQSVSEKVMGSDVR